MLLIRTLFFVIITSITSVGCGYFFRKLLKYQSTDILNDFFTGLTVFLAFFQIECLIGIFFKISLEALTNIYAITIGFFFLMGILYKVKLKEKWISINHNSLKDINWGMIICVSLLVGVQACMIAFSMRQNSDDSSYIAITNTALETNTLLEYSHVTGEQYTNIVSLFKRWVSPFNILMAVLTKYIGIHSTVLHHVILPLILIPLAYIVYWQLGKVFIKDKKERWVFLLFICIMHIFGGYSEESVSTHLLVRIWQGKSIYAAIFIPWLIYRLICLYQEKTKYNWVILFISSIAGIVLSNVAVIENIFLIFVFALLDFYKNKNWKHLIYAGICCLPMFIAGVTMVICMYMMGEL